MMSAEYLIECPICDIQTTVEVTYDDDQPRFCAMCGSDVDAELQSEEDQLPQVYIIYPIKSIKCRLMNWTYEEKEFNPEETFLEDYQGFVYIVTELSTGKK